MSSEDLFWIYSMKPHSRVWNTLALRCQFCKCCSFLQDTDENLFPIPDENLFQIPDENLFLIPDENLFPIHHM